MYIAGPIFGLDLAVVNNNFNKAAGVARSMGFTPFQANQTEPNQHPGSICPPGRPDPKGHNEACHLRADMKVLLACDAAFFMAGWTTSWGCKLEMQVATACGIAIYTEVFETGEAVWMM